MIIVLTPSDVFKYHINEFETTEEAMEFINSNSFKDAKRFKLYDAKELQLTLELKEVKNAR